MNRINLFRKRDFGDLFQDSFQYVFRNPKSLLLPLVMWVVPLTAISGILNAYFSQDTMTSLIEGFTSGDFDNILQDLALNNESMPIWIFPAIMVIAVMATSLTGAFIYEHMLTYLHEPQKLEEPEYLRDRAFNSLGGLVASFLTMFTLVVVGVFLFTMLVVYVGESSPPMAGFLGFAGFLGLFYAGVTLYFVFFIQLHEEIGPMAAIKRAFQLIRGNWWFSFGLILVMSIVLGIMASPITVSLSFTGAMGTTALVLGQIVIALVSVLVNVPLWVAIGLQYFNITDLPAPNDFLEDAIDQIGNE
ncbi:MAG: hypothetical protein AAF927_29270 [Bacteroidota bacterium]